jgi:hypothetical protein
VLTTVPVVIPGWQYESAPSAFAVGDVVDWVLCCDLTDEAGSRPSEWSITLPVLDEVPNEHGPVSSQIVFASDGVLNVYVRVSTAGTPTEVTIGVVANDRHEQIAPPSARTTRLTIHHISVTLVDASRPEPDGRLAARSEPFPVSSSGEACILAGGAVIREFFVECVV